MKELLKKYSSEILSGACIILSIFCVVGLNRFKTDLESSPNQISIVYPLQKESKESFSSNDSPIFKKEWIKKKPKKEADPIHKEKLIPTKSTLVHEKPSSSFFSLDINTADADELQKLPGIGPKLSRKIIDFRKSHGSFVSTSDLLQVDGVGQKKLKSWLSLFNPPLRKVKVSVDNKSSKKLDGLAVSKKKKVARSKALVCSNCLAPLMSSNSRTPYFKPYCPSCLHYRGIQK